MLGEAYAIYFAQSFMKSDAGQIFRTKNAFMQGTSVVQFFGYRSIIDGDVLALQVLDQVLRQIQAAIRAKWVRHKKGLAQSTIDLEILGYNQEAPPAIYPFDPHPPCSSSPSHTHLPPARASPHRQSSC